MAARAFLLNLPQAFWLDVTRDLASAGRLQPVYWTGNPELEGQVRRAFPNAIFHLRFEAARGVPAPAAAHLPLDPLDDAVLRDFATAEAQALRMMERMDAGDSFPYRERVRLYHRQLRYWRTMIRRLTPDMALFYSSPHLVYDFVLYEALRRAGVRTMILKRTSLPDWNYVAESLEGGSPTLNRLYRSMLAGGAQTQAVLQPENENYLERLRGDYSAAEPAYMKAQQRRTEALRPAAVARKLLVPRRYPAYARAAFGTVSRAARALSDGKPAKTLLVRPARDVRETPTVTAFAAMKIRSDRRSRRLKAYYERLARPVDQNVPYVFCALHMQPERTTSPEGGSFVHQEVMVDLLAKSLPDGWRLYVKEHASQFLPEFLIDSSLAQARSEAFYDELTAHSNVTLAPLDVSSFELTDRARAVATVTGTVGWEAVVRGVPVLAFGHAWYGGCDGVHHTPNRERLRAALAAIRAGERPRHERVRLFIAAIETVGFRAELYSPETGKGADHGAELVESCRAALDRALAERPGVAGHRGA